MKCKYKKFLKAAYIDYEEDYCSNAVLRSSRPPLSEILAPATFEITLSPGEGYYWTTFYTSMANYLAPEGVTVYKEHLEGRSITPSTVDDRIINKGQGVVIRSSTNTITLTKTYSRSSDDYSDNSLIGTDYLITNPGHAYALGYKDSAGVAFYRLSSTGKIRANKAYLIIEDIYLTQWRLVGNSTVHTDEYLTQWKVSGNSQIQQYLTQWKVEGNSVVDNNAILSCGDLGQDGKYHVKISNGVDVFDIALTEPLRKVGDVADSIEFANGIATLTRKTSSIDLGSCTYYLNANGFYSDYIQNFALKPASGYSMDVLCAAYPNAERPWTAGCMGISLSGSIWIGDTSYESTTAIKNALAGVEMIYKLAAPTTETIQAPQILVSSTNTYSSANDTPYSAFTYANPLIYSCGDYSDVDGKYHVKISNGVNVFDISLDEPLRKAGNVADSIELVNGVATLTRKCAYVDLGTLDWGGYSNNRFRAYFELSLRPSPYDVYQILNTGGYTSVSGSSINSSATQDKLIAYLTLFAAETGNGFVIRNEDFSSNQEAKQKLSGIYAVYELATPTTEVIQVSPFPISSTDTYTSANDTPYSAFEYKKNVEIWSCGEYSEVDGKYHILVQPQGGSIADIALDEPLRKVNDVADNIEFANGVATITRCIYYVADMSNLPCARYGSTAQTGKYRYRLNITVNSSGIAKNLLCTKYSSTDQTFNNVEGVSLSSDKTKILVYDNVYNGGNDATALSASLQGVELIYELETPTTEIIQVPQIEEADSYSCVISQGAKAVSWSSFETE